MLFWPVLVLAAGATARRAGRPAPHRDVATTQGSVRGYLSPTGYTYLGVPYARPPTRERFKAPDPPPHWDGIFEATHRMRCHTTDNCLVLNVFTPERGTSLPVLVQIHAGGFQSGWGPHTPPSRLLNRGIVVVTFNYRLGIRGFLCLGLPQATGNAGIKDQVAALYWVQRNIDKFGGSPHDVTLYGTESGAASIQVLLMSGITEGLFHRVIMESGSILSPASITYNPIGSAVNAARNLGYEPEDDPVKLLKFYQKLREKDLSTILEIFLPCVENSSYYSNSLFDDDPKRLLTQGNFQKVPMLLTYPHSENTVYGDTFNTYPDNFEQLLPNNIEFESSKVKHEVAEIVKDFYFGHDNADLGPKYARYAYDLFIAYPVVKSALLLAMRNTHPVFLMRFDNNAHKFGGNVSRFKSVFDYVYSSNDKKPANEKITDVLITLWSNFIKLGDPTPLTTELIPIIWQPVVSSEIERRVDIGTLRELVIGNTIQMKAPASSQYLVFWDRIYRKFYKSYKNVDF